MQSSSMHTLKSFITTFLSYEELHLRPVLCPFLLQLPCRSAVRTLFRPGHLIHTSQWRHITAEVAQDLAMFSTVYTQATAGAFQFTTVGFGKATVRANYFCEVSLSFSAHVIVLSTFIALMHSCGYLYSHTYMIATACTKTHAYTH